MSSSDETTGTGEKHEPVQDGYRDHCGTCWRGVEVSAPPGEVRYRVSRAPWPCENARLRERVALLERMAEYGQHDLGCYAMESRLGEAAACKCGFYEARTAWATLAQADETGGGAR